MVNISNIIIIVMLSIIIFKQIQYIKKLRIRTIKSMGEIITMIIFLLVIFIMTISLAKGLSHYFIGFLAIVLFFLDIGKQGISSEGILLVAKGKELYYWNEIGSAKIKYDSKKLRVIYYSLGGIKIINHIYDSKFKESILNILKEKNITIKYIG